MKRLLDVDPITGVECYFDFQGDQVTLTHEQSMADVQRILDANKRAANDDDKTKRGIKNDWWKYATIPAIVEVEWMTKYGVSLGNQAHKKRIFELLNSPEYKYLKTTSKFHSIKHGD